MLRKIDCVMLRVEDLDAAAAYYVEVFGLRVHWRRAHSVGLGMPETDAEIVLALGHEAPPEGQVHYLVDDVAAAAARLRERGCAVLVEPFDIEIGKCAVLADPFGVKLCILDMTKGPLSAEGDAPSAG